MKPLDVGAKGDEVTRLQVALNARSDARGLPKVAVDGELGPVTLASVIRVGRALGALESTLKETRTSSSVTVGLQRLIRYPETRSAAQLRRAKDRSVKRSPSSLRERAYFEAVDLIGVMEVGGNNQGAKVSEIIRANGGSGPEPWCGDFVAYCYRRAGSKVVDRRWAYVPYLSIVTGLRKTSSPRRGDLVRFEFTGDSTPDHVGLFVRDRGDGTIETIEGNTGRVGAVSDSRTGGDGVYRKVRSKRLVKDYVEVTR